MIFRLMHRVFKGTGPGLFLLGLILLCPVAQPDTATVVCTSPTVTAPSGGGSVTSLVNCVINASQATGFYRLQPSSSNLATPSSIVLPHGATNLYATRQSSVISPDGSVYNISGTSAGFTANLTGGSSAKTVQFSYVTTTTSSTPAGTYQTNGGTSYQYQICTNAFCSQIFNGTAPFTLTVAVGSSPVAVSCSSQPVTATAGGGTFNLAVVCTASGGNPSAFSPSAQNVFSPSTVTLSNGKTSLNAMLQPTVTSPDASVTSISGTAGGGFSGTISNTPAKIQVYYTGQTTSSTAAGTYTTSSPVHYAWSTI